ncbi:hypothetical protein SAMN03080617_00634 [Algoriphagus alkaliphilus]|uniref:Uncharacterized protein n=1 Tax=Algoriphagus alkaliphilus TaxID=279824 RepID=A0A1G5VSS9_9BACT|nr:hypothetical protein SAMN03080617_00634 [Algoriphagus alkaliphilus]
MPPTPLTLAKHNLGIVAIAAAHVAAGKPQDAACTIREVKQRKRGDTEDRPPLFQATRQSGCAACVHLFYRC